MVNSFIIVSLRWPSTYHNLPPFLGFGPAVNNIGRVKKKELEQKLKALVMLNLNLWRMLLSYFIQNPHLIPDNYVTIL